MAITVKACVRSMVSPTIWRCLPSHGSGEFADAVLEQAVRAVFDLTPSGMISTLGLNRPIFARFCNYGHFTHQDAPWEQTDRTELLVNVCRTKETGVSDR